jgi:hypothetical protein
VHERGRGEKKNATYIGGLARRRDVEVAVVELGGDVLVRAGTRGMGMRQVGRKERKRAPGGLSSVEDWGKDGCYCSRVG